MELPGKRTARQYRETRHARDRHKGGPRRPHEEPQRADPQQEPREDEYLPEEDANAPQEGVVEPRSLGRDLDELLAEHVGVHSRHFGMLDEVLLDLQQQQQQVQSGTQPRVGEELVVDLTKLAASLQQILPVHALLGVPEPYALEVSGWQGENTPSAAAPVVSRSKVAAAAPDMKAVHPAPPQQVPQQQALPPGHIRPARTAPQASGIAPVPTPQQAPTAPTKTTGHAHHIDDEDVLDTLLKHPSRSRPDQAPPQPPPSKAPAAPVNVMGSAPSRQGPSAMHNDDLDQLLGAAPLVLQQGQAARLPAAPAVPAPASQSAERKTPAAAAQSLEDWLGI